MLEKHEIRDYRKQINQHLSEIAHLKRVVADESQRLCEEEEKQVTLLQSQMIIQHAAKQIQDSVHQQISAIVSRCLEAIFGDEAYQFHIQFEEKRGRTEARMLFVRDGNEIDPLHAAGGGVIDVVSFALRLACLILTKPAKRRFIALDEPFSRLSAAYRPHVATLLEELAEDLDFQILLITHSQDFMIGEVIEL